MDDEETTEEVVEKLDFAVRVPIGADQFRDGVTALLAATASGWRQEAADESVKGAANTAMIGMLRWGAARMDDLVQSINRMELFVRAAVLELVARAAYARGYPVEAPEGYDFEAVPEPEPESESVEGTTFVLDDALGNQEPETETAGAGELKDSDPSAPTDSDPSAPADSGTAALTGPQGALSDAQRAQFDNGDHSTHEDEARAPEEDLLTSPRP